jgi:hypothetical protein
MVLKGEESFKFDAVSEQLAARVRREIGRDFRIVAGEWSSSLELRVEDDLAGQVDIAIKPGPRHWG